MAANSVKRASIDTPLRVRRGLQPARRQARSLPGMRARAKQANAGICAPTVDADTDAVCVHDMRALSRLTGGIAHDFNNILASIVGYADLLEHAINSDRQNVYPPSAARYLAQIQSASDRARRLISQLLLYSHGSGGQQSQVDVRQLVSDSVQQLRAELPDGIELHTEHAPSAAQVQTEPELIAQVLANLVQNACDAMNGRGRALLCTDKIVVAHVRCASCRREFSGNYARIRVIDSGPGIGRAAMAQLFEPFYTTKQVGQGAGLGLSVVHGVMHQLGGHVVAASTCKGSSFSLLRPLTRD